MTHMNDSTSGGEKGDWLRSEAEAQRRCLSPFSTQRREHTF